MQSNCNQMLLLEQTAFKFLHIKFNQLLSSCVGKMEASTLLENGEAKCQDLSGPTSRTVRNCQNIFIRPLKMSSAFLTCFTGPTMNTYVIRWYMNEISIVGHIINTIHNSSFCILKHALLASVLAYYGLILSSGVGVNYQNNCKPLEQL